MQTLRFGKAEPKIFTPPQTPFLGAWDGQNFISWRCLGEIEQSQPAVCGKYGVLYFVCQVAGLPALFIRG